MPERHHRHHSSPIKWMVTNRKKQLLCNIRCSGVALQVENVSLERSPGVCFLFIIFKMIPEMEETVTVARGQAPGMGWRSTTSEHFWAWGDCITLHIPTHKQINVKIDKCQIRSM